MTDAEVTAQCGNPLVGLPQRSRELTYIMHRKWDMPDGVDYQFLDVNPSFERVSRSGDPWFNRTISTITGSMKAVVRHRVTTATSGSPAIIVRPVHGLELMSLAGWAPGDYAVYDDSTANHATLSSLAGNAFSAYAIGPILAAA